MERYEKYKDSGVEWIGEIPEGWEVKKLKYEADLGSGNNLTSEQIKQDGNYPVYGGNGLRGYYTDYSHDGDFVLIGRQGALCGNIHYGKNKFWATDHAVVAKQTSKYEIIWFGELLRVMNLNQYSVAAAQPGLAVDAIKNLLIPVPSLTEQTTIANYIDRKTIEIDKLIAQKERLLGLYEEEKTAIINQAVTKGISPDVKLKDSGIDWLGEIPESWQITSINRLVKVKDGTHETPKYINESESSYPLVTSKDFHNGKINFSEAKHISREDHESIIKRSNTERNDIIMSMIGGNIGKLVLVSTQKTFSIKNVALFKTCHDFRIAKHVFFILQSSLLSIQIELNSRGGAQGFLSLDDLRGLIYFVLPLTEIKLIVQHLEAETARINAKINKTQKIISLQKEYRTALISEVVTGKIKVTEEVAA